MNYCPLHLTDKRFAYVPSWNTDIAETFRQHQPIRVSPVHRQHVVGDDYDDCERTAYLENPGAFK